LPGFALAVFEPDCELITHLTLEEDGHAQERSRISDLLQNVESNDLWIADRNFCCWNYISTIIEKGGGFFIVRQHSNSGRWIPETELEYRETTDRGELWEQKGYIEDVATGKRHEVRRLEIRLTVSTRDGDTMVGLFTNLLDCYPADYVSTEYLGRWKIETSFQEIQSVLNGEINTLSYPEAVLFSFSCAIVSYNILSAVRQTLRASQPSQASEVSVYYVALEMVETHGVFKMFEEEIDWDFCPRLSTVEVAKLLLELGKQAEYRKYTKRPPNKKTAERIPGTRPKVKRGTHVSTAKIIKTTENQRDNP
ncbi:MAG: transposase, partial [Thermoguttaceae bacterium]